MRVTGPVRLGVALLLLSTAAACGRRAGGAMDGTLARGDHERTLRIEGIERYYVVHVPPGEPARAMPVVLAFHGGGGNARQFQRSAGLDEVADREGFLVVYTAGTGPRRDRLLTWNAGVDCCGLAHEREMDDVAFTRAVVEDLARAARIDRSRVFATGHSNGAMMAYRVAVEAPDLVAAIAPVGGAMQLGDLTPRSPVPVLHIHSVDDPRAPYEGGLGPPFPLTDNRVRHAAVEGGLARWRAANRCTDEPVVAERRPDGGGTDASGHRAEHLVWSDCASGVPVELWRMHGPGHAWPGAEVGRLQERIVGEGTTVLSAAEEAWRFFQRW